MKSEKEFVNWFIDKIRKNCVVNKIESTTLRGIPDLNILNQGKEIWCEMKVFHSGRALLRPEQFAWGMRHASHGGRVFVIAHHESGIHVWKFPDVQVVTHSKYLWVTSLPVLIDNNVDKIKTLLFT